MTRACGTRAADAGLDPVDGARRVGLGAGSEVDLRDDEQFLGPKALRAQVDETLDLGAVDDRGPDVSLVARGGRLADEEALRLDGQQRRDDAEQGPDRDARPGVVARVAGRER